MVPLIFTKFGKMMHFDCLQPADHKGSEIQKFKMVHGRHFENHLIAITQQKLL